MLQYKGDHTTLGYWYEWINYKDRFEKTNERQLVRCGDSMPMLWNNRAGEEQCKMMNKSAEQQSFFLFSGGPLLGFLDMKTEEAHFSANGKADRIVGKALGDMLIIVRNLRGGPIGCPCDRCQKEPPKQLLMLNEWADIRMGDPWPTYKTVKAADKTLNAPPGESPEQMVALWYVHGEPVMGRIWNRNGKVSFSRVVVSVWTMFLISHQFLQVAAAFGWGGKAFIDNIGSIQVLVELPDHVRGFNYHWIPYKAAAIFDKKAREYHPVHVDMVKGGF